jgi:hypothetical protein
MRIATTAVITAALAMGGFGCDAGPDGPADDPMSAPADGYAPDGLEPGPMDPATDEASPDLQLPGADEPAADPVVPE